MAATVSGSTRQSQQCPTEEERGCPFLMCHQIENLSWAPHSLCLLKFHLQDYVPGTLLNQSLAKDWSRLATQPHVVGVEGVGVKRQTKPRLCSEEEDGLAARTANTSTPGSSFTPCHDFPSLVSPPFPEKALVSYCSILSPSTFHHPHFSQILLSLEWVVQVCMFLETLTLLWCSCLPRTWPTASAQHPVLGEWLGEWMNEWV